MFVWKALTLAILPSHNCSPPSVAKSVLCSIVLLGVSGNTVRSELWSKKPRNRVWWSNVPQHIARITKLLSSPRDRSLPAQPISRRKTQSRKKPIYLCAPRKFPPNVSVMFVFVVTTDKQNFRMFSLIDLHFGLFYRNYPQINGVGKSDHTGHPCQLSPILLPKRELFAIPNTLHA